MGASRLCVFLVVLVSVKMMAAQPIFSSRMWCDMMCDDDDDDDYDDDGDIFDYLLSAFDPCGGCPSSKPTKSKTTTLAPGMQQPLNLVIPPANGMNVTMTNTGSSWLLNFIPWMTGAAGSMAPAGTTPAPATTAAGTTAAGNSTAAPSTTAKA